MPSPTAESAPGAATTPTRRHRADRHRPRAGRHRPARGPARSSARSSCAGRACTASRSAWAGPPNSVCRGRYRGPWPCRSRLIWRSASRSTRPASVLPNLASMMRSGSSGLRLPQNLSGGQGEPGEERVQGELGLGFAALSGVLGGVFLRIEREVDTLAPDRTFLRFSEFLRGTPGVYARVESHPRGCGAERRSIAASARPRSGRVSSPRSRVVRTHGRASRSV